MRESGGPGKRHKKGVRETQEAERDVHSLTQPSAAPGSA